MMKYLYKLFYEDKNIYENTYKNRFNFEETLRTGLFINSLNKKDLFELYYVYNKDTANYIDRIRNNDNVLKDMEESLPKVAKNAFLIDIMSSELKSTNDLEGVKSSKEELVETTRKRILYNEINNDLKFNSMVNSYALLYAGDVLTIPDKLEDIRKIYDCITSGEIEDEDLPDGKLFRKDRVYVKKKGSVGGEIIHEGVYGEDKIEEFLYKWMSFMKKDDINPLLKIAVGHYYFGYIHPFYDGNGRVSRFISSLYIRQNFNYFTSMSLARGSWMKKSKYYKAFDYTNSSIGKGEMNYFVDEFLKILITGQEDIIENLRNKSNRLSKSYNCINQDDRLNTKHKRTIMYLLTQNYYFDWVKGLKREEIIKLIGDNVTEYKVKDELEDLLELGYIKEIKKRPLIYVLGDNFIDKINNL